MASEAKPEMKMPLTALTTKTGGSTVIALDCDSSGDCEDGDSVLVLMVTLQAKVDRPRGKTQ